MTKYPELAKSLQDSLKLDFPPIAVCLADQIPAGVPSPDRAFAAGCAFWQEAMKGPIATAAKDHELCAIGVHTHNLAGATAGVASELESVLKVMADMTYVRPEDVPLIPVLNRQAKHVIYAPLAETPLAPDVVLVFAHSRQGLIIAEAARQVDPDTPPAMGRPACALIPQAVNSGRAALSLGCCGARAYLSAFSDEIALWALPGPMLPLYCERIQALAGANETLTRFHQLRQKDVDAGLRPTYEESLSRT